MKAQTGYTGTGVVSYKTSTGVVVRLEETGETGFVYVARLRGNNPKIRDQRLGNIEKGDTVIVEVIPGREGHDSRWLKLSEKKVHDDLVLAHMPQDKPIRAVVDGVAPYGIFCYLPEWGVAGLLHRLCLSGANRAERDRSYEEITIGDTMDVFAVKIAMEGDRLKIWLAEEPVGEEALSQVLRQSA